jgi:hypothetical protein
MRRHKEQGSSLFGGILPALIRSEQVRDELRNVMDYTLVLGHDPVAPTEAVHKIVEVGSPGSVGSLLCRDES